jgi:signal transduction histidine kinase
VWLAARGPLLAQRRSLKVRAHQQRAHALIARLRITDAAGSGTVVSVR